MSYSASDPPYRSVRHAIREAYASEELEVVGRTPTTRYRSGPETDGPDGELVGDPLIGSAWQERASGAPSKGQHPFERIAEGAGCMSLIRDTLDDDLMTVCDAYFTLLGEPLREVRKYAAVVRLAGMVLERGIYGPPDQDFAVAAVAQWAGFGRLNPRIWSDYLGVTDRTMRNWRNGRGWYGVGIGARLRVYLAMAEDALTDPMAERGLVFRVDDPICDNYRKGKQKGSAAWSGLLSLRWRKPSNDKRPGEVEADIPNDGHGYETEYRRAG